MGTSFTVPPRSSKSCSFSSFLYPLWWVGLKKSAFNILQILKRKNLCELYRLCKPRFVQIKLSETQDLNFIITLCLNLQHSFFWPWNNHPLAINLNRNPGKQSSREERSVPVTFKSSFPLLKQTKAQHNVTKAIIINTSRTMPLHLFTSFGPDNFFSYIQIEYW